MTKAILNKLSTLKVICGVCRGNYERAELEAHMRSCPIPCVLGCGQKIAPKEQEQHENICPKKMIECPRCGARVAKGEVNKEEHLAECPVACPNGCSVRVAPNKQSEHNKTCTHIPVSCPRCKERVARAELENKHLPRCPIPCEQGCGATVAPMNQTVHNQLQCPRTIVGCSAADVQCPWRGQRSTLEAHVSECPFCKLHPLLIQ